MRLYLNQKVLSFKDKSTVKDQNGEDKYFIEGKVLSLGKKLTITDYAGREVAHVNEKIASLLPKFLVEVDGEQVAEIVKKITFLKAKYLVNGPGWEVNGDLFSHDYTIVEGGAVVATIHKQWMSWGDTFEIDIDNEYDEITVLAVVLAIDACIDAQNAAAASSGFAIGSSSSN